MRTPSSLIIFASSTLPCLRACLPTFFPLPSASTTGSATGTAPAHPGSQAGPCPIHLPFAQVGSRETQKGARGATWETKDPPKLRLSRQRDDARIRVCRVLREQAPSLSLVKIHRDRHPQSHFQERPARSLINQDPLRAGVEMRAYCIALTEYRQLGRSRGGAVVVVVVVASQASNSMQETRTTTTTTTTITPGEVAVGGRRSVAVETRALNIDVPTAQYRPWARLSTNFNLLFAFFTTEPLDLPHSKPCLIPTLSPSYHLPNDRPSRRNHTYVAFDHPSLKNASASTPSSLSAYADESACHRQDLKALEETRRHLEDFFTDAQDRCERLALTAALMHNITIVSPWWTPLNIFDSRTYSWPWKRIRMRLNGNSSSRFVLLFDFSRFSTNHPNVVTRVVRDLPPVVLPAFPYALLTISGNCRIRRIHIIWCPNGVSLSRHFVSLSRRSASLSFTPRRPFRHAIYVYNVDDCPGLARPFANNSHGTLHRGGTHTPSRVVRYRESRCRKQPRRMCETSRYFSPRRDNSDWQLSAGGCKDAGSSLWLVWMLDNASRTSFRFIQSSSDPFPFAYWSIIVITRALIHTYPRDPAQFVSRFPFRSPPWGLRQTLRAAFP
ncbi:hypothetical protein C8J57DRAFT_1705007 [Mycena rebaudengoi]|nr:hypothetical protein C8J57DRAFT_1705007 [Mycena rebaudengoi]